MIKQLPPILLQSVPVFREGDLDTFREPLMTILSPMKDQRRRVLDGWKLADDFRQFGKIVLNNIALASSGQPLPQALAGFLVLDSVDQRGPRFSGHQI